MESRPISLPASAMSKPLGYEPTDPDLPPTNDPQRPSPFHLLSIIGFLLIGISWGLTTPFLRRAALSFTPRTADPTIPRLQYWVTKIRYTVVDLLRRPDYAVPLLLNMSGSIWFFLVVGSNELSLTVPITNSLAFLFTVLGEWWVEGKAIGRETGVGMALVIGGIALCVRSKV